MTTADLAAFPPVPGSEDRPASHRWSFSVGTASSSTTTSGKAKSKAHVQPQQQQPQYQQTSRQKSDQRLNAKEPAIGERDSLRRSFRNSLRRSSRRPGSERRPSLIASLSNSITAAVAAAGETSQARQQQPQQQSECNEAVGVGDYSDKSSDWLTDKQQVEKEVEAETGGEWKVLGDRLCLSNEQYLSITAPLSLPNWPEKHNATNTSSRRVASMMVGALSKPLKRMRSTKKSSQLSEEGSGTVDQLDGVADSSAEACGYSHMDYSHLKGSSERNGSLHPAAHAAASHGQQQAPASTRVIKSGLVKMAVHRMGRTQWKLRNVELCWDSRPDSADFLRLTMFPATGDKAHKRHDLFLNADQPVQVVSEKFPGKHVVLIPCETDYYLSTETHEALIDWVATLKSALAHGDDGEPRNLYHATSLPGQKKAPAGNLLISFKEGSIILQNPLTEVMVYMTSMTSIAAFGANWRLLTCWFEVFTHRRRSVALPVVNQRFAFSTSSVREIMAEMVAQMEAAHGPMTLTEEDGELVYKVSLHDGVPFSYDAVCATSAPATACSALDYDHEHGYHAAAPACTSPQLTKPPKALITQLRERQSKIIAHPKLMKKSQSESQLSPMHAPAQKASVAPVALKPLLPCQPPPKPPRSNEAKKAYLLSPPHSAPAPPPVSFDTNPTPIPRSRPEKPKRSSTSASLGSRIASFGPSEDGEASWLGSNGSMSFEPGVAKKTPPRPAPRTKPKPAAHNPDTQRKALLPPANRLQLSKTASTGTGTSSASGSEVMYQNTPSASSATSSPLAPHVTLQETNSGSSDFAYDYMIAVENSGDVTMQEGGETNQEQQQQQQQERKTSQTSTAAASISSHQSSDFCNSSEASSHSESEETTVFAKRVSSEPESTDSEGSFDMTELTSVSLKKIVGSMDLDSDGELSNLCWALQRDPPDGQEEEKCTPERQGSHSSHKVLTKQSATESVEVDHLYMNFQSSRLPRGGSEDET